MNRNNAVSATATATSGSSGSRRGSAVGGKSKKGKSFAFGSVVDESDRDPYGVNTGLNVAMRRKSGNAGAGSANKNTNSDAAAADAVAAAAKVAAYPAWKRDHHNLTKTRKDMQALVQKFATAFDRSV